MPFLLTMGPQMAIVGRVIASAVGAPGRVEFAVTGNTGPVTWSLLSSTLPAEWDSALTIDGIDASLESEEVEAVGTFAVRVRVVDTTRQPIEVTVVVRTIALPITIDGDAPVFVLGQECEDVLTLSGGSGTYASVEVIAGALPAGVSAALIVDQVEFPGEPTTAGAWSATLRVTDSLGATATRVLSGTATEAPPDYATMNPADKAANWTLSAGDLQADGTANAHYLVRSTIALSGKVYFEVTIPNRVAGEGRLYVGMCADTAGLTDNLFPFDVTACLYDAHAGGFTTGGTRPGLTATLHPNVSGAAFTLPASGSTTVGFAVDVPNSEVYLWSSIPGTWTRNSNTGADSDPSTGTRPLLVLPSGYVWVCAYSRALGAGDRQALFNFGQSAFVNTPPAGFSAGLFA